MVWKRKFLRPEKHKRALEEACTLTRRCPTALQMEEAVHLMHGPRSMPRKMTGLFAGTTSPQNTSRDMFCKTGTELAATPLRHFGIHGSVDRTHMSITTCRTRGANHLTRSMWCTRNCQCLVSGQRACRLWESSSSDDNTRLQ